MKRFADMLTDVAADMQQLRGRVVRWAKPAGGGDGEDSGSDSDSSECDCTICPKGVPIPDADPVTGCCDSHLLFYLDNPWRTVGGEPRLDLEYIGNGQYLTQIFDGPEGNPDEYRWLMEVDVSGTSYLRLVRETDNGGDEVCIIYGRDSFDCQCVNEFFRRKPYGQWDNVPAEEIACKVCVVPNPPQPELGCPYFALQSETLRVEINDDTYCLDGPYEAGELPATTGGFFNPRQYCAYLGPAVNGLFPILLVGRNKLITTSSSTTYVFGLCDSEFVTLPNTGYLACTPDGYIASWGGTSWMGTFTKNLGGASWPDTIDVETSDINCDPYTPGSATNSGACADSCMTDATPDDPDSGACCIVGWCYDYFTESLCSDLDGVWSSTGCGDCDVPRACCLPNDDCVDVTSDECDLLNGTAHPGMKCDDEPCDTGACCRASNGGCEETIATDCVAPDYWWGAGTDCDPDPCPDIGACCHNNNGGVNCGSDCECWLLSEPECDALDVTGTSNYGGDGTYCDGPGAMDCDCRGLDCDFA